MRIITVVNRTRRILDYSVQLVLRAINRQLAEDFEPHWHCPAQLRLHGAIGRRPSYASPKELRGDAILYLSDTVDVDDALGYHAANHAGVPFGVVFTKLADELGEPWSVTLSHEALEMAVDPLANLLAVGPHPGGEDRYVMHWVEVCDAVQGDRYTLDEVWVSNFVLPHYFSEGDEPGTRNDFLGMPLRSFGVRPDGYAGFFDPQTGQHDYVLGAKSKLTKKRAAGLARRAERRMQTRPERWATVRRLVGAE